MMETQSVQTKILSVQTTQMALKIPALLNFAQVHLNWQEKQQVELTTLVKKAALMKPEHLMELPQENSTQTKLVH